MIEEWRDIEGFEGLYHNVPWGLSSKVCKFF